MATQSRGINYKDTTIRAKYEGKSVPYKLATDYAYNVFSGDPVWKDNEGYVRSFGELESAFLRANPGNDKTAAFKKFCSTPLLGIVSFVYFKNNQMNASYITTPTQNSYIAANAIAQGNHNVEVDVVIDPTAIIEFGYELSGLAGTDLIQANIGRVKLLPTFQFTDNTYTQIAGLNSGSGATSAYFSNKYVIDGNNRFSYAVYGSANPNTYTTIGLSPEENYYPLQFFSQTLTSDGKVNMSATLNNSDVLNARRITV